jgi:aryl-alcohol dehydrogenase-like predicted oxidoreductase
MTKLILGTAQFGSDYGVKHDGQPSEKEIEKIARVAWDGGIRTVHTSWQYGLPKICDAIFDQFEKIEKDREFPHLFKWGNDGVLSRLGMSAYNPDEIKNIVVDMIVPVNVLDRRWLEFKNPKHKLIARSVFLQGLLLMDPDLMPDWVTDYGKTEIAFFQFECSQRRLAFYEAALGWVLGLDEVDYVIVGVNSTKQLEELLAVEPLKWDYDFSIQDENVLDPRRWPTLDNQLKRTVETSTAIEGVNLKL